jgi:hypothetical protein
MPQTPRKERLGIPAVSTLKRGIRLSRIHLGIAIFFAIMLLTVWNPSFFTSNLKQTNSTANSINSTAALAAVKSQIGTVGDAQFIAVALGVMPSLMLATPIILLFVYDKNNGMLEYFLSLGMRQREIYTNYLKAALLLTAVFLLIFSPIYLALGYLDHILVIAAEVLVLMTLLSFADIAFMIIAMFAFSSLQKTRAGGNQPVGIIVGVVWLIPGFFIPLITSMQNTIVIELGEVVILVVLSAVMLLMADRLISREKFLP